MNAKDEMPPTLSREFLYELAWSKPISKLAKEFGISDVALAKRCVRLGIPIPGRGYWARVEAGQRPYRPRLPGREPQMFDNKALTLARSDDAHGARIPRPEELQATPISTELDSVRIRIAALSVTPTVSILDTLAPVKRAAGRSKHPRRTELKFGRGEKIGPIVALDVTIETLDRALLLADTLLRAASTLGWHFDGSFAYREEQGLPVKEEKNYLTTTLNEKLTEEAHIGRLLVEGEQLAFRIEERLREDSVEPTSAQLAREKREYGYHALRKKFVPTGALRLVRLDTFRTWGEPERRSWYDRKGKRVEEQIPEILLGFYELALSIKERREKREREAREAAAREEQRKEWEAIREANQALIAQIERDAGAWHRARYLRRYLAAARKVLGKGTVVARFREERIDYLDWAERYVNQIDPLHTDARTGEFECGSTYHFQNDLDRMKKAFGRLLGGDWSGAWKVGKDYTPQPKSGYHYGEEPVFEIENARQSSDED